MLTLLVGGARSGKSALAVEWGRRFEKRGGRVTFVATAIAPAGLSDDDLTARIQRHRDERPPWPTVEEPHDLAGAVGDVADDALLVVDCLTLWVSNRMAVGDDPETVVAAAREVATRLGARSGPGVVVTNEVGLGVHPVTELGRDFRDLLGRVNRAVADVAGRTLFLVAGRVVEAGPTDRFVP